MRLLPPTLFFPETKRFWFSANKKQCGNALTSDRHKKPQKINALQTESPDAEISPDCEQIACQITKNNVKAGKKQISIRTANMSFSRYAKTAKNMGRGMGKQRRFSARIYGDFAQKNRTVRRFAAIYSNSRRHRVQNDKSGIIFYNVEL